MSQGKGISDAVRGAVREWITPDVEDRLWTEFQNRRTQASSSDGIGKAGFTSRLRAADYWVRRVRRGIFNGWERDYDCKGFARGVVGLRVHTNQADTQIRYVTFRVDGKLIGGGVVSVPSVLISQRGRNAAIQNGSYAAPVAATPKFRPFTADELHQLATDVEFGSGTFDSMFEDRA